MKNAALLVLLSLAPAACESAVAPATGAIEFRALGNSTLALGTTHTQYSADPWGEPAAVARATAWLAAHPLLQNQHLMGWGATNPEPSPGAYDWSSLDRRMALITRTGGVPVITLCCAPDWMKGGAPGETDWSRLEAAPLPEHFTDFAELARQAALRYPAVRHFQVWNELKGFYLPAQNRWDYEGYTALYNQVYTALKSVRPDAIVGGPYVVMDSWSSRQAMSQPSAVSGAWGVLDQRPLDVIDYWLRHAPGAEFITVDLGTRTRDAGLVTDPFTALGKYAAVVGWLRARTSLPVWLAEWYVGTEGDGAEEQAAAMLGALIELAKAGASTALQWGPQADGTSCVGGCLWTDTRTSAGGTTTPLADAIAAFLAEFPPGTPIYEVRGLPSDVTALASSARILLINHQPRARTLRLGRQSLRLGPYGIGLMPRE